MIYDPIRFVKLVQKILVGNYEPIMGICWKIFIINSHNLQMLFMLWINYEFSECLAPLHKHEGPEWKTFLRRFCPGLQTRGGVRGQLPPNLFCALQLFFCSEIFVCFIWYKQKSFPPKNDFPPKALQPGYVRDSDKIVSAIRIFCFEGHSASRCSITSKTFFYKSPLGGGL